MSRETVLKIKNLTISFDTTAGKVHAIRGVNLELKQGETLAVLESPAPGKSVTVKAAMGILANNATVDSGTIEYSYTRKNGEKVTRDILTMPQKEIREHINGKRIAMVFQDPMTSLNPLIPIGKQDYGGRDLALSYAKGRGPEKGCRIAGTCGNHRPGKEDEELSHISCQAECGRGCNRDLACLQSGAFDLR